MSYKDDYYSEGDYRCNHPESDFEDNSEGPIQLKREGFVEYTHRNEVSNQRYDVWNRSGYSNTSKTNAYSTSNTTKSSIVPTLVVLAIIFLPFIFSILGTIIEVINDNM